MKIIFKTLFLILLVFFLSFGMIACSEKIDKDNDSGENNEDIINPTLSFEKLEIELKVGETYSLNPNITELSGNDLVDYTIDNERIISISGTTVTALAEGSTVVHASLKGYDEIKVDISFTVITKTVERKTAKLDASFQGTYTANGISVVVEESKLSVSEENGNIEFTLYTDEGGLYILDRVGDVFVKIYITFSSDRKTINVEGKGSFIKEEELKEGEIPSQYQGTFASEDIIIETSNNSLKITNALTGEEKSYLVYTDRNGLFVIEGEKREYFTIERNVLSIFSKKYPKDEEITLEQYAKLSEDQMGEYHYSDGSTATVKESSIIFDVMVNDKERILYQDNKGIYYYSSSNYGLNKIYIKFDENSMSISGTVYIKNGADELASIDSSKQAQYFDNKKSIRVFSNSIMAPDASGMTNFYNVYVNNQGMYFIDTDNSHQYISFDDYSVTIRNTTYYKKYTTNESVRGSYMDETRTLYINENEFMVFTSNTDKITYTLFIDQNGLFYYDESNTRQTITFTDNGLICVHGTFVKQSALNEHTANLSEDLQGEYTGNGMRYVVYNNGLYVYTDGGSTYSYCRLTENALGIYYITGSPSTNIYCKFEDNKLINKFGTFEKTYVDKKTEIDEKYAGYYVSGVLTVVLHKDSLEYHNTSTNEESNYYLNIEQELYVVLNYNMEYKLVLNDDKIILDCEKYNQHMELNKIDDPTVNVATTQIPARFQRTYRYYDEYLTLRYNTVEINYNGSISNQYITFDGLYRFTYPEYGTNGILELLDDGAIRYNDIKYLPVVSLERYAKGDIDPSYQGRYIYNDESNNEHISLIVEDTKITMINEDKSYLMDVYASSDYSNVFYTVLDDMKYEYYLVYSFGVDKVTVTGPQITRKVFIKGE